jgi:3-hydroxyacyl-CoA dehydrogenase/enoyl-CoA hydratase/carnithine racemase
MAETELKLQRLDSDAGPVALLTIDNGEDWQKPTFLGRAALESLDRVLDALESSEWAALVLTGKPFVFCAGADIDQFPDVTPELAREGSRVGHELFARIAALPFPTVAAINGACLGGGVEIALHCSHRTISTTVRHFACPEVFLGIFPAWGGTQLVPRLVGPERAVEFIVANPLRQNRMLDGRRAFERGYADQLLEPAEFVDESIAFALELATEPREREPADTAGIADIVRVARAQVDDQLHGAAPAPYVALDLIEGSAGWTIEEGYQEEEKAIAELMPGREAQASIYAFNLVERRAKKGVGIPDVDPSPIRKIGIVGAGLMATQIATLFLRRLEVPILLRDLDQAIVDESVETIRGELAGLVARGRYDEAKAGFLGSIVSGGTSYGGFEDCDLVLEAVVERMDVKQEVFRELRELAPNALLATNTSSLSVGGMGADVGLHFFNPVALMPLVEIVRTSETDEAALATAWDVTQRLRKRGVVVADAPGFVVNRVLTRMTSTLMRAIDHGNSVDETDEAMLRLGMPMAPSVILAMVGAPVANHVLGVMHEAYPDRFPLSPALAALAEGEEPAASHDQPQSVEEITEAALEAMADEIGHMLDEGVVGSAADVDTCLLLGAGFPFFLGGITRYLDDTGISERTVGRPLASWHAAVPA